MNLLRSSLGLGPRRLGFAVALGLVAIAPAALAKVKIACIGASTTQGSGAPAGQSYPDQLAKLLGAEYEVRNFGKSGAGALRAGNPTYWNSAEFNAATAYAPDLVINWLGGADSKAASWDRHKGEFLQNYQDMIKHFQDLPTRPRVISMLSVALYDDAGVRKVVLENEVNPLQRQGAMAMGSPMVDLKTLITSHPEYFNDGVHLKASGYAAVARAAHAAIQSLAPSDAGAPPDAAPNADAAPVPVIDAAAPSPIDATPAPSPDAAPARTSDSAKPEPEPAFPRSASKGGCSHGGSASFTWLFLLALPLLLRRRALLGTLLVTLTATTAQAAPTPAEAAQRDGAAMAKALVAGDAETFVAYSYPGLVKDSGGQDKMIELFQKARAGMMQKGVAIVAASVKAPEQIVKAGKELHTVVQMTFEMATPKGTGRGQGYLIGVSADKGKSWTFVDSTKLDEATRKRLLPSYNPALRIPPTAPPTFTPK